MDVRNYYSTHSAFTNPGLHSDMLEGLPSSAPELSKITQGIMLDYDERWKYPIRNERLLDTNSRYMEDMLECVRFFSHDPIDKEREMADRYLGTSSDFATFTVSLMRNANIPARARYGFVDDGKFIKSYEIVEYFENGAWQKADPFGSGLEFIPAYKAWQLYRDGKIDTDRVRNDEQFGEKNLICNLILDLAAVMKNELVCWDRYGWMRRPIEEFSNRAYDTLDKLASLLEDVNSNFDAITKLYESEEGLYVPEEVVCDSPVVPPHKIKLNGPRIEQELNWKPA